MRKTGARVLLLGLVLALAACVTSAENFTASPELEAAVRSKEPVADKARVHFFLGLVDSPFMIFGPLSNKQPADLIANGLVVGGVNAEQVLVLDLDPGEYKFAWGERTEDGHGMVSNDIPVTLHEGELVYLRADWRPSAGAAFGIVGALADPPKAFLVSCAPSECANSVEDLKVVVASK